MADIPVIGVFNSDSFGSNGTDAFLQDVPNAEVKETDVGGSGALNTLGPTLPSDKPDTSPFSYSSELEAVAPHPAEAIPHRSGLF